MSDEHTTRRPANPMREGDAVPMRPEEPTFGRLEREMGETRDQVTVEGNERTIADAELPIEERREQGIEDNTRHVDSIGRR